MCETCGCSTNSPGLDKLATEHQLTQTVMKSLMDDNDHQASHNRDHFNSSKTLVVNLMSGPGSGKTSLLERIAERFSQQLNLVVIEGDLATENDANRLREKGIQAVQINTTTACHLDAAMIHQVLHQLDLAAIDILFIENVGNLVCPASFDLGQHLTISLLSTPEGDDKPEKYPILFKASDIVIISKTDLLPVLPEFKISNARRSLTLAGFNQTILEIGRHDAAAIDELMQLLHDRRQALFQENVNQSGEMRQDYARND